MTAHEWSRRFSVVGAPPGLLAWLPLEDGAVDGPFFTLAVGVKTDQVVGPAVEGTRLGYKDREYRVLEPSDLIERALDDYNECGPSTYILLAAPHQWDSPWVSIDDICWSEPEAQELAAEMRDAAAKKAATKPKEPD